MSLAPGTRLGPYEIVSAIGAGGMGEVYRARDARLGRDVAIKILPELFSVDADRVARFQREAQVLASLNHPHIAQIYGLEDASPGVRALVLELVDGPTLADVIAARSAAPGSELLRHKPPSESEALQAAGVSTAPQRGSRVGDPAPRGIPIDEALAIARQIAEALEAAHENGIVHRDLKPANIKLTHDGAVKVLDFGLAKALDRTASGAPNMLSGSPTITSPAMATNAGMILGTAVYMSPEQAKGKPADKRSDIWAFGCVLYEMLTGKRAFDGEDLTDVVAAVVRAEPDWTALPLNLPAHIRTLLKGCLEKDRKARLADIAVVRYLLEHGAVAPAAQPAGVEPKRSRRRTWIGIGTAAALALIAAASMALAWTLWNREAPPAPPMRMTVEVGADVALLVQAGTAAVLSPDATVLAFVGNPNATGSSSLWLRRLDQLQASPLAGTDGAFYPVFAPDGSAIAFFAQGKLKKVAITGGAPVTLCDAPNGRGATWSEDGWIYFAPDSGPNTPIERVLAEGGTPETAVKLDDKDLSLRWPQILPGGKVLLITAQQATGSFETGSIVAYSLTDRTRKVVHQGGYYGRYVRSGHLLYVKEGTVFAAPFDLDTLAVTGRAVPAIQGVSTNANSGGAHFAVSDGGATVYLPGDVQATRAPIRWIDRTGKTDVLRGAVSDWSNPSFSPDGQRLAIDIYDGAQTDVWVYEWARDTLSRLTFDRANDARPVWSPTGKYIAYASQRAGVSNLYLQRADGTGDALRLTESRNAQFPSSWHPSGKYLAYFETAPGNATDLMILPLEGDEANGWKPGKPQVFLASRFTESSGMFSPDGRWIAYMSNESGRNDIYVRPFPGPGGKWQISTAAADDPTWSRNARDFFFLNTSDSRVMTVPYRVDGDSFRADKPRVWLDAPVSVRPRPPSRDLDLHPDGKRFAVAATQEQTTALENRVVFVLNFFDELRRIAPAKNRD